MGAEEIIKNRGEKSQENHNSEEAYSIWREIKDSHIDNSFQNDRGGRNGEEDDDFKKKKKYPGKKRGRKNPSSLKFLLGSTKHRKTQLLYKVEHKYITQPSIPISRYYPSEIKTQVCAKPTHKWLQKLCLQSPNTANNPMSFNRWMDQPTIERSYSGLLFYGKNKQYRRISNVSCRIKEARLKKWHNISFYY